MSSVIDIRMHTRGLLHHIAANGWRCLSGRVAQRCTGRYAVAYEIQIDACRCLTLGVIFMAPHGGGIQRKGGKEKQKTGEEDVVVMFHGGCIDYITDGQLTGISFISKLSKASREPWNTLQSTGPLMPESLPQSVCCQKAHLMSLAGSET